MIKKVGIENYRSIKSLEFEPQNLCALVGQNNVGKSNILAAINLLLGEYWPLNKITPNDIYNRDSNLRMKIKAIFDTPIIHSYYGTTYEVYGLGLDYSVNGIQRLVCLDQNGRIIKNKWDNPISVNNELRESVPCVIVQVDRNLEKELRGSQWTIFGRILKEIEHEFKQDEDRRKEYTDKMSEAFLLLKTERFTQLEDVLREQVKKLTGFSCVNLRFSNPDVLDHYRNLNLIVRESPQYNEFPALDMGAGIQSSIYISIMEAYRQINKSGATLIIEEPEVYLHPHARRYFNKLLMDLADQGNQIFYSTHSTEFVNLPDYESIHIIRKSADNGTCIYHAQNLTFPPGSKEELKLLTQFDARRNEIFFANKVLLVEGPTERFSIPYLFLCKGVNIHESGISIVDSESKDNLIYFIKIMSAFSIPFVVLHDTDTNNPDYLNKHITLNQNIQDAVGDSSLVYAMDPDFEAVFGIQGTQNDKIRKGIEAVKSLRKEDIPSIVVDAIDKLISL